MAQSREDHSARELVECYFTGLSATLASAKTFPGGVASFWATKHAIPVGRATTVEIEGKPLVTNTTFSALQRAIVFLRPDLSDVGGFRDFFEWAAPPHRRVVEPRIDGILPGARALPVLTEDILRWFANEYSQGLIEEFTCDAATYTLERREIGTFPPLQIM